MDKFYYIEIHTPKGNNKAFISSDKTGKEPFLVTVMGPSHNLMQFETHASAEKFMKDHKLERSGMKGFIKDQDDLKKEFGDLMNRVMFYIENEKKEKLFSQPKLGKVGYFFKEGDEGYVVWYTREEAQSVVDYFKMKNVEIKPVKPKPKLENLN